MKHPDPIVACRTASDDEMPRSAKSLMKAAIQADWRARATYAQGTAIDRHGEPTTVVESVAVRLCRDPLAAVGVWHDGKWSTGWIWSRFTNPRNVGARALAAFIKEQP